MEKFLRAEAVYAKHVEVIDPLVTTLLLNPLERQTFDGEVGEVPTEQLVAYGLCVHLCKQVYSQSVLAVVDALPGFQGILLAQAFVLLYTIRAQSKGLHLLDELLQTPKENLFHYYLAACQALPYADLSLERVLELFAYLARADGDYAFGESISAVQLWASLNPVLVPAIFNTLYEEEDPAAVTNRYLEPLIVGLSTVSPSEAKTLAGVLSGSPSHRQFAVYTLYNLAVQGHIEWIELLDSLRTWTAVCAEPVAAAVTRVLASMVADQTCHSRDADILLQQLLARDRRPGILYQLCATLSHSENGDIERYLDYLLDLDLQYKGILRVLDMALYGLLQKRSEKVIEFLERWVISHPDPEIRICDQNAFPMTCRGLSTTSIFLTRITAWFIGEDPLYREAVNLFQELPVTSLPAGISQWGLSELSRFVLRLFRSPGLMGGLQASLLVLLLRMAPHVTTVQQLPEELQHFVWNYPGLTQSVLEPALPTLPAESNKLLSAALEWARNYHASRDALHRFKELHPNPERVELFRRVQARRMAEQMEELRRSGEFLWTRLATRVAIARGTQTFSRSEHGFSHVTTLKKHEQSVELPRGELIDPEGELYRRLLTLGKEVNEQ